MSHHHLLDIRTLRLTVPCIQSEKEWLQKLKNKNQIFLTYMQLYALRCSKANQIIYSILANSGASRSFYYVCSRVTMFTKLFLLCHRVNQHTCFSWWPPPTPVHAHKHPCCVTAAGPCTQHVPFYI